MKTAPSPTPAGSPPFAQALRRLWTKARRWRSRLTDRSILVKILVALTVTLGLVVGIYTYLILRIQERWSDDRFAATCVIAARAVQEQFSRSLIGGVTPARHPPTVIQSEPGWPRVWVVDEGRRVLSSTETNNMRRVWDSSLASRRSVSAINLPNREECRNCHDPKHARLAQILMAPADNDPVLDQTARQRWLLVYGFLMAVLILSGMTFCLVRFVRQPLARMAGLMGRVQKGDLSARFRVRGHDEVAQLGRGFNRMIRSLTSARASLQQAHHRQIQQAEKLASVGELASGLAHEIRNPLAGIKTAVEVLSEKISAREGDGSNGDLKEVVQEVGVQIERIHRLVGDLLRYVRPKPPETVACDLRDLLKRCLHLVRPQADKQKVEIRVEDHSDDHKICADPGQIEQAILNISLNAIQAMPQGGTLTLAMRKDAPNGFVILKIQDTGEGISPEAQQHIFSPFFTTKAQGTGLGLSITRAIIESHRGRLDFASERGKGAVFTISLPLFKVHGCGEGQCLDMPGGRQASRNQEVIPCQPSDLW